MAKKPQLKLPVEFGGVSIGDKTLRIAVRVSRDNITLEQADQAFCDRRLIGKLVLGKPDDGQKSFVEDLLHEVEGAFDVKGFRVNATAFTAGLTFGKKETKLDEIGHFAKGTGTLVVMTVEELPVDEDSEEAEESDSEEDEDAEDEGEGGAAVATKPRKRLAKAK